MDEQNAYPRILIVEDDQDDILLSTVFIKESNLTFSIRFFSNGDQLFRNSHPVNPGIEFGVIVSSLEEQSFINFDDLGIIGFIQKPITPEGLRSLLDKYQQDFRGVHAWSGQSE